MRRSPLTLAGRILENESLMVGPRLFSCPTASRFLESGPCEATNRTHIAWISEVRLRLSLSCRAEHWSLGAVGFDPNGGRCGCPTSPSRLVWWSMPSRCSRWRWADTRRSAALWPLRSRSRRRPPSVSPPFQPRHDRSPGWSRSPSSYSPIDLMRRTALFVRLEYMSTGMCG